MLGVVKAIDVVICVFILAWAAVGLYIYTAEMVSDCKAEDVGVMILAWAVTQYVLIAMCIACFFGAVRLAANERSLSDTMDTEDSRPLKDEYSQDKDKETTHKRDGA